MLLKKGYFSVDLHEFLATWNTELINPFTPKSYFKFRLQPHQKYCDASHSKKNLAFHSLLR